MNRLLEHLAEAIRIRTVADDAHPDSSHDAVTEFHHFLQRSYPRTWSSLSVEIVGGQSLLMSWQGDDETLKPIILLAHMDVVPVEADADARWSSPPFDPTTTDTHLVGRGAIDDKGGLIAMFEALETLIEAGFHPHRTVIVALGHDEETTGSGAASMAAVLEARGVRAALVLDEGGFVTEGVVPATRRPIALVGVSEKGYLDLELSVSGSSGHSSAPPRSTAIGALATALTRLQANPMPPRLDVQAAFFEAVSEAAPIGARGVLRRLPGLRRLGAWILARRPTTDALIRTTMAPTVIRGGIKHNVLPASARAVVNFRLLPGDTTERVIDHVRHVVGPDIELTAVRGWDPSDVTDTASPGYLDVAATIGETFPGTIVAPWVVVGATDARHYTRVSDTVLRFLPFRVDSDELAGFHGIDERIRLADAGPAVAFYRRLLEKLAG